MKNGGRFALAGFLVFGLSFGAWRWLAPSQEEIIRNQLKEMAQLASFNANDGALAKAFNAQKLSSFCTPDVELAVSAPGYQQTINGRDEILSAALRTRSTLGSVQIELPDILVTMGPDKQSAVAEITARIKLGGEKDFDVRELKCALKKLDGAWLVSRVESERTLLRN